MFSTEIVDSDSRSSSEGSNSTGSYRWNPAMRWTVTRARSNRDRAPISVYAPDCQVLP